MVAYTTGTIHVSGKYVNRRRSSWEAGLIHFIVHLVLRFLAIFRMVGRYSGTKYVLWWPQMSREISVHIFNFALDTDARASFFVRWSTSVDSKTRWYIKSLRDRVGHRAAGYYIHGSLFKKVNMFRNTSPLLQYGKPVRCRIRGSIERKQQRMDPKRSLTSKPHKHTEYKSGG